MAITSILIANRGEIAIRIARAARELGLRPVCVHSEDDAQALHVQAGDRAAALPGRGPAAYLDAGAVIAAARDAGCDAIHPGYGFLSENAAFAEQCQAAGLTFIGPPPEVLRILGDKAQARALAAGLEVPLLPGTGAGAGAEEIAAFLAGLGEGAAVMIKAVAGGGGRGMRAVAAAEEVAAAWSRCRSEAQAAFGDGALYAERLLRRARHVEVQVIGDGRAVIHAHDRDCTLQRQGQKLVEIAPAPHLAPGLRQAILDAALRMARHFPYRSLGTFEFLVDLEGPADGPGFYFMEANPRLQVEHTVTEEATGLDLVATQIRIAAGCSLAELDLATPPPLRPGHVLQLRLNAESMTAAGDARPEGGVLSRYEPPSGPGIRVDGHGHAGHRTNPRFDSLLAKLVLRSTLPGLPAVIAKGRRALAEFRLEGLRTNRGFLDALLARPELADWSVHTTFVRDHAAAILAAMPPEPTGETSPATADQPANRPGNPGPEGTQPLRAHLQGAVCAVEVAAGERIRAGQQVAVLEAMKMEHPVLAPQGGLVRRIDIAMNQALLEGDAILWLEPDPDQAQAAGVEAEEIDLEAIRPDLRAVLERHRRGLDAGRPQAVARRRARNQRTARENLDDLFDPGSFTEYGALALAAQRQRRSPEELLEMSPADGLVSGIGTVNAALFGAERAACMGLAYDFTVFAGTQGWMNHKKKDRLFDLALKWKLPVVLFGEGGGGRPGETDGLMVHGLDTPSFGRFAALSGEVPLVAIVSGRCFAGNAALVGVCDLIIATLDANLGMGGPAMVEGGGLGVYAPEEIGPVAVQSANGVVDLVARDEAEAVRMAKHCLAMTQGALPDWTCADQRRLRWLVPENRRRLYDIRELATLLADEGSLIELRAGHAPGMMTAFLRIEGRPMGLLANDPAHLGGAVDARGADKAASFMRLCDRFGLPVLSLCDTPGFMVGPEAEEQGQVRSSAAMFVAAAKLRVPFFTVVLRKGYGLGAQSMAAGGFHAPLFTVAWPTGEFGGMGLEGAVRLGYRRELEAIADEAERQRFFDEKLAHLQAVGTAVSMAGFLEIDAVIDPAETRAWIVAGLRAAAVEARTAR